MSARHGRPKRRRLKRPRQHLGPHAGIAVASACDACAYLISGGEHVAPGRHMGIIHAEHVPELVALGWVLTEHPADPPDVTCLHYHLEHWEGGHGDDCCGLGGD
jgi:hypothetical protein